MSLKSMFAQSFSNEKVAEDRIARIQSALGAASSAVMRDEMARVKQASSDPGEVAAARNEEKAEEVLERAKEIVRENPQQMGRIYTVGAGEMPENAAKTANDEALKTAAFLNLINHVKVASNASAYLEKVACFVCGSAGCGVCDGTGVMTKSAAEELFAYADALSDVAAADALSKHADQVQEASGNDGADYQAIRGGIAAAQSTVDGMYETLLCNNPGNGVVDFGGRNEEFNPLINFLKPNRVHTDE